MVLDFDDKFRESMRLGNYSKMVVMGRGNGNICFKGRIHVITDVYYIAGLGNNLLSVGQLQQRNITIVLKSNVWQLFHGENGFIITNEMKNNRMYAVKASVIAPKCFKVTTLEETTMWHNIYAHLNIKGLKTLHKKQMVKGFLYLKDLEGKCGDCLVGK